MAKKRKLSHPANKKHKAPGHPAGPKHGGPKGNAGHANNNSSNSHSTKSNHERKPAFSSSSSSSSSSLAPTIPFDPEDDNILLVGEGDLSFAASLVQHHKCAHLTATVYEASRDALLAKYPHAADNIAHIEEGGARVLYGVDAKTMGPWGKKRKKREEGEEEEDNSQETPKPAKNKSNTRFDRILFNFPHVGGKSTDVNRQVRYNQELLVAFFQRALLSLAPAGAVVVTLFEGEPYTLWNIRDLARHAGLQVERSFRFQFAAYPGYHHARTLGVVVRKGASSSSAAVAEASQSAWRGEDRPARSYVFVRKGAVAAAPQSKSKSKGKRGRDDSSSDDDDDSGED